ncbi:MAG: hypothetical protein WCO94_02800 [Verrucomicrobiota bacterium]
MTGTGGNGLGAGRASSAGAVRVLPLLADDAAGGVDCLAGAGSLVLAGVVGVGADVDLVEAGGVDRLRVALVGLL